MLCNRIDNTGSDVAQIAVSMRLMLVDGHVDDGEITRLEAIADQLTKTANELDDVATDIQYAQQVLRIGRHRSPERHLRDRMRGLELVCGRRERETASERELKAA
jgi:hypothetical protein